MQAPVTIRAETNADAGAIRAVHAAAFPTEAEASLVDLLRSSGNSVVSLVAEAGGAVAGHVLFSPVSIRDEAANQGRQGLGLAPLAVLPAYQRRGIGSALVLAGLEVCRQLPNGGFVVVLGNPAYYARFGFERASGRGLRNEYGVDEEFLVLELAPRALPGGGGLVRYGPEFAAFS